MTAQLSFFGAKGFDPRKLAAMPAPARGRLYNALGLDHFEREKAEAAVRRIQRRAYPRAPR